MSRLDRATEASNKSRGSLSERPDPAYSRTLPATHGRASRWVVRSLFGLVLAAAAAFGLLIFETPPASEAEALVRAQAAKHRTAYPSPNPPRLFIEALLATEDHRFYSPFDPGIDPFAVARAVVGKVLAWPDQGGSTIEQQLAKLLYTPRRRGPGVEVEQVVLAFKLSFTYTKPELLAMYSTVVYFGNGYYGLEKASCGYYGTQPVN